MPMGKASSIGLGLALAQPSRKVIVLDGDGSLLMNLGSLVTIANMAPANFVHFVFENGIYRTTGGQPIPNAGKISFSGLAKCAGYRNVHDFADLVKLENAIETVLSQTGPTFACLKVPACNERSGFALAKMNTVIAGFMATLQRPEQMSAPGHPFVKTVD
ncbi:MAG: hypothetical protein HYX90_02750 [Chloroflexi bacterium]|nr:hypothetical protein [Chloroflexota bacterium]